MQTSSRSITSPAGTADTVEVFAPVSIPLEKMKRIVSRPDFDGIVCAMLLYEAEDITEPVIWLEPREVQKGDADIGEGDIIANLPFDDRCFMWFDHHISDDISNATFFK